MADMVGFLESIKEELFDAGLDPDDLNDVLDYLNDVFDDDDDA